MNINVYRSGSVIATIPVDDGAKCKRTIAGVDEISMEVVQSSGTLAVNVGDYIIFENRNYYLNRPLEVDKRSAVEYQFTLVFEADSYTLLNKLYQQPVTGRGDFSLVDSLEGFVDVLLTNINSIESGWTKGNMPTSERKTMTFDGNNCREVLNMLADTYDMEFVVIGKQINFYSIFETATSLSFKHGKGNGLYQLTRENVDSDNTVTRGWFWGAAKNIDYTYRDGETRLMFTNASTGTNRIDNFGDFNKVVEKQVVFEDIFPHFTGTIATVSNNTATGIHTFTCPEIDFDLTIQLIEGLTAKVFFKSGDLQSQEFEIKSYDHATRTVKLITYTDEFGQVWPNASFYPKVGDQFTFLDINMPATYVVAAENELATKAAEWMDYYSKLRVKYSLELDPRYLRNNAITLNLGDVVRIIDTDLSIDKQIRITSIEKNIANPYKVNCEISNIVEERWEKLINKKVQEALNNSKTATEKVSSTTMAIGSFFGKYFEIRGTEGNEYICAKFPFASVGAIVARTTNAAIPSIWDGLPTATATTKGGIVIGPSLAIDPATGVVNVASGVGSQTLSIVGTTLSISNGNSVTIPSGYSDAQARAACAESGTVYDSARLGGVAASGYLTTSGQAYDSVRLAGVLASSYTRRDVNEDVNGRWKFTTGLFAGTGNQGTLIEYDTNYDWGMINPLHHNVAWTSLQLCQTSGNVGIGKGNTAPAYKLDVSGDIRATGAIHASGNVIASGNVSAVRFHNGLYGSNPQNARNHFVQYNSGISEMSVGWIAAAYGDATAPRVVIGQAAGLAQIGAHNGDLAAWDNLVINWGGGNVIIGYATTTTYKLHVEGSEYVNGNILASGAVTARTASDAYLKHNVRPITDGMALFYQLRPVEFDYNDMAMTLNPEWRKNPHSASFIAQEWEQVLPWATGSIFENYKGIDNHVLHAYTAAALVQLDKKIDSEVELLRKEVSELKMELKQLKRA